MKHIYGPVKSRRLGLSLGISLTPYKVCNFDCLYCQLGKTTDLVGDRKEYLNPEDILDELRIWLQQNPQEAKSLDYFTLSGSGEPTLNTAIAQMISEIKKIPEAKVAVITNAGCINDPLLRQALGAADLIVPSLTSATQEVLTRMHRPHQSVQLEDIVNGLVALRKEFTGKIWLEVMLVKGVNDDMRKIKKLKVIIDRINPDKIQLNSPVRSTAEPGVFPVARHKLEKIREILGDKCEIV
jgi:wyosine [tRNA(Phe)-imidazoG37] synthetase (radical SAM superfamily)